MKIGDKFKIGKSEYTVVSVFVDNGSEFYVAKKVGHDGFITYSNVFTYNEEGKLYKRS
jgi:hypothetical protein